MQHTEAALTAEAVKARLHTQTLGRTLTVYPVLASTNDTAKAIADTAAHGTVILAVQQEAGRGRRGRSFFSPDGGIYMSVILRDHLTAERVPLLTTAAALATARAIERFIPETVSVKWVNDLLIHGKKICGILTEGAPAADGTCTFAVIGIGINVSTMEFPPEIGQIASSIRRECTVSPDRAAVIAAVLEELEAVLSLDNAALLDGVRARSAVLGKTVTVLRGNETFTAVAVAIDDAGGLVIETANGRETLRSGEVSLRLS